MPPTLPPPTTMPTHHPSPRPLTRFAEVARSIRHLATAPLLAFALGAACGSAQAQTAPYEPTGALEQVYSTPGPWAVSVLPQAGCCDSAGFGYAVWQPSDLGRDGFRHPIISFGNGTGAVPEGYDALLRHLASWGFVVIATRQPNTGIGTEILDAARFLALENARPGSPWEGRLATDRIGVLGHSQGATGAVNALIKGRGAIRTAVALAIPAQRWCSSSTNCTDSSRIRSGSVFYLNGSLDAVISPSRQNPRTPRLQSNAAYYDATPAGVDKLWATLLRADHNDMMGQPGCEGVALCSTGVYGYLGYPTAWMMDRLQGDTAARAAFVSGSGELFFQTQNWRNQTSNIAP